MRLVFPWALVVLPVAVGVVWVVARFGSRTVSRRQHRWAVILRVVAVSLLGLALAQPLLIRAVSDRTVLFLLDRSDSIGSAARVEQERLVTSEAATADPQDRWGVAVFGSTIEVDQSLAVGRAPTSIFTQVDGSATDLAGALRSAASLLPSEGSRRVVVLTDLVETTGDAREAAAELAEEGIAVDVIALDSTRTADALVESVRLPAAARRGDRVPVEIVLRSNTAGRAVVTVETAIGTRFELPVDLVAGRNEVRTEIEAGDGGYLPVSVTVSAGFDTRPENDRGEGITRVLGPAQVAIVEGVPGEAEALARGLAAGGLEAEVMPSIPTPERLLSYDAVVLVNIPRPSADESEALAGYVQDLGRGLVVIGGDQAYGLGDYHETPLEAVLPVSSNPDDLIRRQPVAEVLVIDTSGSMAACHCNAGISAEGGVNKTDISRAGAALAIDALSATDRVGVLSFSSGFDWVIPLAPKPDQAVVEKALGELFPNGDTEIATALGEALFQLQSAPEELRHIVLFTDGWDPDDANLLPIARDIADAGITLSVLATGEGPGSTLSRMADIGGGRFYPGTDLSSIPEMFVEETLTVARHLAIEGSFLPAIGVPSVVTEGLTSAPPLLGYVATKSKGTASVALEIGQGDPLLASWQRGLGRVTAWTSDATTRWSAGWVDWTGYVDFWGRVVRDVLPAGRETPPEVYVDGGVLRVSLDQPELSEGATAVARVRGPDGSVETVPLRRSGATTLEGETRAAIPGAYWVAVTVENPDGGSVTSGSGAVSSYQEEFSFRDPDPTLGADIAARTGGRLNPDVGGAFDPAPERGRAERPIWPWLAAAGLGLFLVDVALRRLVLFEGDGEVWREGIRRERTRQRRRVEEVRRLQEVEPDRAPAVVSDSETLQRLMRRKRR